MHIYYSYIIAEIHSYVNLNVILNLGDFKWKQIWPLYVSKCLCKLNEFNYVLNKHKGIFANFYLLFCPSHL
jgi:hypothetical protein